jgi:hypothetical protein
MGEGVATVPVCMVFIASISICAPPRAMTPGHPREGGPARGFVFR